MSSNSDKPSAWSLLKNGAAMVRGHYYLRSATSVGSRVRIWGTPSITNRGILEIGDRVRIIAEPLATQIGVGKGGQMTIGERTFINYGCSISASQLVRIGPRCNIGSHTILMDNDFHSVEPERRDELPPSAPIILEENVWVGVRAVILRGVTIGAGSVIAAGSVVSKDVAPRSLVGGIPAKLIRKL
jgi:acetyltransferase-like isoleucine patch superfamily enzyme